MIRSSADGFVAHPRVGIGGGVGDGIHGVGRFQFGEDVAEDAAELGPGRVALLVGAAQRLDEGGVAVPRAGIDHEPGAPRLAGDAVEHVVGGAIVPGVVHAARRVVEHLGAAGGEYVGVVRS